ncbi:MAG: hypothetical protein N2323_04445 [candidate division WOR-3 bacterium]|nr:hypothetical protein [candidate division WOR-3 bacterium]MCX7837191.1 hypothetical protein [candidate division WOR-3 bacterium]MDW8113957.1 hypothetical protein [candidate division WOR-3 bacterium]
MKELILFFFILSNDWQLKLLKEGFKDSLYLKYKESSLKEKKYDELKSFSLELLKRYPKEVLILITLGEIEIIKKNFQVGYDYLEEALKISRESNPFVLELLEKYKKEVEDRNYPILSFLSLIKLNNFKRAREFLNLLSEEELKTYYQILLLGNLGFTDSVLIHIFDFLIRFEKSPLKEDVQEIGLLLSSGKDLKDYFYALLLLNVGEKEKAIDILKKINQDYSLIKLAEIYQKENKIQLALSALENALKTKDDYFHSKAQYFLALFLLEKDEVRAIMLLEDIVLNHPLTPYTFYSQELLNKLKIKGIR